MRFRIQLLMAASIALGLAIGCNDKKTSSGGSSASLRTGQPVMAAASGESEKGAAQLWAENCNRCHNFRPASTYSDYQWTVVMHHMRVRANLTAEESKEILQFLQASN
jgi:hypothetical protein